jgi:hypothetical protein
MHNNVRPLVTEELTKIQWIITRDHIHTGRAGNGTYKGSDPAALPYEFRLLDGDGYLYYEGRSDDRDSEAAFAPLDWAEGYAGAVTIEYRRNGKWEVL